MDDEAGGERPLRGGAPSGAGLKSRAIRDLICRFISGGSGSAHCEGAVESALAAAAKSRIGGAVEVGGVGGDEETREGGESEGAEEGVGGVNG